MPVLEESKLRVIEHINGNVKMWTLVDTFGEVDPFGEVDASGEGNEESKTTLPESRGDKEEPCAPTTDPEPACSVLVYKKVGRVGDRSSETEKLAV